MALKVHKTGEEARWRHPATVAACLLLLGLLAWPALVRRNGLERPREWPVAQTTEVELKEGRLTRKGTAEVFTGWLTESYGNGVLRSRSFVSNGVLEGLSEGWHTNGVLQVSEQFVGGRSDGPVTKWSPGGVRLSEATTRGGLFEGRFQRWHTNGVLAEEMEMHLGKPHGLARSWYPSGNLKAEVQLENGKVVAQRYWDDVAHAPGVAGAGVGGAP
jgi:antitoxin component YwqK of YwqJK toxin-antitoxin module